MTQLTDVLATSVDVADVLTKLEALVEHWQHTAERFRVQWQESEWYLGETRALLTGPLRQIPELAVRTADPAAYVAALDGLCGAVGQHLVTHFGLERKGP